jgi:hypothetical protein
MAKSKTGVSTRRVGGQSIVVVEPPRAVQAAPRASGQRRRRRRGGGGGGGGFGRSAKGKRMMGVALGGFAYGIIEKSFPGLPTLPVVGKSGTVAIAVYFLGGNNDLINDVGIAAAAIAGYSLGKTGTVSGYDDSHGLAAEV